MATKMKMTHTLDNLMSLDGSLLRDVYPLTSDRSSCQVGERSPQYPLWILDTIVANGTAEGRSTLATGSDSSNWETHSCVS